jgi:hypothetical protein
MYTNWAKEFEQAPARTKAVAVGIAGGYPDEGKYYVGEAKAAIAADDAHMFAPANIARVVKATGLSIQTVNEVIRELRVEDA